MSNPSLTSVAGGAGHLQGHPRGLYTLFLTEMWERFSYYGMRALLVLFMVDSIRGGQGLTDEVATAIYGLYTAGVYLAALPGGWVADRFLGAQRSVWYGGILIAIGQFTLAFVHGNAFYLSLVVVVLGTGLLKPNVSAIVGDLYPEGGARRDAGFTIFYMGINLGATLGPLVASTLGEKFNWHYGFAAAGFGMVLGLIQYRLSAKHLGECGRHPGRQGGATRMDWMLLGGFVGAIVIVVALALSGILRINPLALAQGTTYVIVAVALAFFGCAFLFFGLDATEKKRLAVIAVLFVSSAMFWSGFEQAGSSLNLFAERYTQRTFGGFEIPAGWFQSLNPIFIISLAPLVAMVWIALARRNRDLTLTTKFALGLGLLAMGFMIMATASKLVGGGQKVWPTWLIATYVFHSVGELCLSPVGLSSVTKLAPRRLVGQMMGIWFLATSLGNLIAGLVAGQVSTDSAAQMSARYLQIVFMALGVGGLLLVFTKPIKSLMKDVK
jgi:POT family proton-dependent oligopeptide transporter